ncbi:hypothetical protein POL68_17990 [Stigmatella sp. ncwal1]|uniref:Uncharacterized protein n=1 Tax=Stigmatella ashevillensis TaxID=2995309 RepID=A0ABT5DC43_9BACT|nr:hypothetical protein [Stigmatella ashevillena]MDC0710373.1 hypothetical protein [Stigmatella ashevillena]
MPSPAAMNLIEPIALVGALTGAVAGALLCWPIHPLLGAVGAVAGILGGLMAMSVLLLVFMIVFTFVTEGPRAVLKLCREVFSRSPPAP